MWKKERIQEHYLPIVTYEYKNVFMKLQNNLELGYC